MIDALVLGHRWQVQHVVILLTGWICKRLDFPNFEAVTVAALRLREPDLLSAVKAFIAGHADEMHAKLMDDMKGFHDKAVIAEVRRTLNVAVGADSAECPRKRRRVS